MAIPVYSFGLDVRCIKMVQRKDGVAVRFSGADREIALTPLLGEAGAVQTTKSLYEAAGVFEISFGDQLEQGTQDSVYARVEPMDMIEIRAAREPHLYSGKKLPLVMRGFVDQVRRTESIGDDGRPRRAVVISGHDMAKIALINHVYWELAVNQDKPLLTVFGMQAVLGLTVSLLPVSTFITEMVEKVLNGRVAAMEAFSSQLIKRFTVEATVKAGKMTPTMLAPVIQGSYWNVMSTFADRPWNELWVRDDEGGPVVVFRPAPFRDLDGKLILEADGAADPGTIEVGFDEVVQWDVSRTDARVANFYWVPPGASSLLTNSSVVAGSIIDGSAFDSEHGNNKPDLYGAKKMEVTSALLPTDLAGVPSANLPASDREAASNKIIEWCRYRASQLKAMNRDNSVLEDAGATVLGRETHVVGKYLRTTRGEVVAESYVTSVSHTFQSQVTWTTTLRLERGNGFLERAKMSDSPFILEGRPGPYSSS